MHGTTAIRAWPHAFVRAGFIALASALLLAASQVPAATEPPAPGSDTRIELKLSPPGIQVDTAAAAADDEKDSDDRRSKRRRATIRIDSDRDFESFKDAARAAPWVVGLVFLVVGSIFLTPVILLIGIVWYKLRKTRMQNEALVKLAEQGVVPAAQAVDSVVSGVMPGAGLAAGTGAALAAGSSYQQTVATRRRVIWTDLRRGVLLTAIGLSLTMYSLIEHGSANWVGLVLLFLGVGYVVLWWFEDRHLGPRDAAGGPG
jgi:hypothetical protein